MSTYKYNKIKIKIFATCFALQPLLATELKLGKVFVIMTDLKVILRWDYLFSMYGCYTKTLIVSHEEPPSSYYRLKSDNSQVCYSEILLNCFLCGLLHRLV